MSKLGSAAFVLLPLAGLALLPALLARAEPGAPVEGAVSIGNSNDGRLQGGMRLPDRGLGYYSNPHGPNADAKYGTEEMVRAIAAIGEDLEHWAPGATLFVNDIGLRDGGPIAHHQSHQAGRDVDFLFYATSRNGKVARPVGARFDGEGRGRWDAGTRDDATDDVDLLFDTRRNWLVVRSLIENRDANVQRIFVAEGLRTLMLSHARESGEPAWVVERAGELLCEPETPHDDHLFCTAEDYRVGCRDTWPLFPWRRTELAGVGILSPELGVRPPAKAGKRTVPPRRRKTPGRTWCP